MRFFATTCKICERGVESIDKGFAEFLGGTRLADHTRKVTGSSPVAPIFVDQGCSDRTRRAFFLWERDLRLLKRFDSIGAERQIPPGSGLDLKQSAETIRSPYWSAK